MAVNMPIAAGPVRSATADAVQRRQQQLADNLKQTDIPRMSNIETFGRACTLGLSSVLDRAVHGRPYGWAANRDLRIVAGVFGGIAALGATPIGFVLSLGGYFVTRAYHNSTDYKDRKLTNMMAYNIEEALKDAANDVSGLLQTTAKGLEVKPGTSHEVATAVHAALIAFNAAYGTRTIQQKYGLAQDPERFLKPSIHAFQIYRDSIPQ